MGYPKEGLDGMIETDMMEFWDGIPGVIMAFKRTIILPQASSPESSGAMWTKFRGLTLTYSSGQTTLRFRTRATRGRNANQGNTIASIPMSHTSLCTSPTPNVPCCQSADHPAQVSLYASSETQVLLEKSLPLAA